MQVALCGEATFFWAVQSIHNVSCLLSLSLSLSLLILLSSHFFMCVLLSFIVCLIKQLAWAAKERTHEMNKSMPNVQVMKNFKRVQLCTSNVKRQVVSASLGGAHCI